MTSDSFSDGGSFLSLEDAKKQVITLTHAKTDWIEVSGQSSNVHATLVSETEEWNRIFSIIPFIKDRDLKISVDSFRPIVQKQALKEGVQCLNDISAFTHPEAKHLLQKDLLENSHVKLVIMHSHTLGIAKEKSILTPGNVVESILHFFRDRRRELNAWGITDSRLFFDPGMGFFLGEDPELSLTVLRDIDRFLSEFPNLMVSVSRKSFLGNVLGGVKVEDREFATLAVEMYLLQKKVPWLRTHNVLKVKQAESILKLLQSLPS